MDSKTSDSALTWADAKVIQQLIEDVKQAELELNRRNQALHFALFNLIREAKP